LIDNFYEKKKETVLYRKFELSEYFQINEKTSIYFSCESVLNLSRQVVNKFIYIDLYFNILIMNISELSRLWNQYFVIESITTKINQLRYKRIFLNLKQ